MHTLRIVNVDDEQVDYYVNDVLVIEANHDDDGWVGMERIDSALRTVARLTDMEVKIEA